MPAHPDALNVLRIFIASPGDLNAEREIFRRVLEEVNTIKAAAQGVHLEPLGWEDTLPGKGRPQALINKDIETCDLFLLLLWKRWGTPSGAYTSGTEEEFALARALAEARDGRQQQRQVVLKRGKRAVVCPSYRLCRLNACPSRGNQPRPHNQAKTHPVYRVTRGRK